MFAPFDSPKLEQKGRAQMHLSKFSWKFCGKSYVFTIFVPVIENLPVRSISDILSPNGINERCFMISNVL